MTLDDSCDTASDGSDGVNRSAKIITHVIEGMIDIRHPPFTGVVTGVGGVSVGFLIIVE